MAMTVKLQDVFREHLPPYQTNHGLTRQQHKAAQAILGCRTGAYGGRVEQCSDCDHTRILYNSCSNRHCPQCQGLAKERWIDARSEDLLPVSYFHVVFTLPEELQVVVLQNQELLYNLLFQSVSQTLLELAADPKYLGAQIGFTTVLHTWGQNLLFHPHLHCIIPNAGLAPGGHFQEGRKEFFLPIRVLAKLFRGKFMAGLQKLFDAGKLQFHGSIRHLQATAYFTTWRHKLYQKDWVVYSKQAFSGPEAVIAYLGRYTHRIAISNHRILAMDAQTVTFEWFDYRDSQKKTMTLPAEEFLRRFLLHVLPHRFMRIRHYGLQANRNRKTKLKRCQRLAGALVAAARFRNLNAVEIMSILVGRDITLCSFCQKGKMLVRGPLPRNTSPPLSA